ncbi:hypothetical protein I3843_11G120800 [Carya illinoinensis]|nr:hypothetical protein I3843_11G120800 [Carya illinoinensis]
MPSRRQRCPSAYLLIVKQIEEENLKTYLTCFNIERLTTEDQDDPITLAALLGGIWPRSPFMAELARRTPSTLREFMNRADDFVNVKYTLQALVNPRRDEQRAERKTNLGDKKLMSGHQDRRQERRPEYNNID